jgi:hypothetical protein
MGRGCFVSTFGLNIDPGFDLTGIKRMALQQCAQDGLCREQFAAKSLMAPSNMAIRVAWVLPTLPTSSATLPRRPCTWLIIKSDINLSFPELSSRLV